jgi:hypothetical protein
MGANYRVVRTAGKWKPKKPEQFALKKAIFYFYFKDL